MLDPTRYAPPDELGLTHEERRRFEMAKAAMQGIRASMVNGHAQYEAVARMAVSQGDAVLKELGLR